MERYIIIILIALLLLAFGVLVYLQLKHKRNTQFYLERQYNEVLNSMQQAILLFDNKDRLLFYNKYAEVAFHLKNADLGKTAYMMFNNEKFLEPFTKNEKEKVFDINFLNKIFIVQIYQVQKTFSKSSASKLMVLHNVTEERKIEETKKRLLCARFT